MKAVRIHEHGGIDKLCYETAPQPGLLTPDDAIVELRAASLNRTDLETRRGFSGLEVSFPHILGSDGAGVIVELGAGVKNLRPGDAVCLYPVSGCGRCEFCLADREFMCIESRVLGQREAGTYAEYVRVPARTCFPLPAGLSFEEAAALPFAYLTSWRMLLTNAELKPGERLLLVGTDGGIASAALQLAARIGARIIVTSDSELKLAGAKRLGAEHAIDGTASDFAQEVRQITAKRGVDVVVDCTGGATWAKSLKALAKGGRLVTCGVVAGVHPQTDIRRIFWNHLKISGSTLGSREEFGQLLRFMERSRTKPVIDQSFPLREAAAAQQRLEAAEGFGKIVLKMNG